ncbi:MAG: hypothetical protein HY074_17715 [Deltaproteobacteria bacterium]|nr:hypothetical protein [Deltaproteobacteria bacterium]
MNSNLIKCLPVFVLALGLSACGKSDAKKAADTGSPAIAAATIATSFEADCGGTPSAAASASSAFDLSQCQLNPNQLNLLQEVGPFKVEADCTRQAVLIKNAAEQISGSGAINPDGTYSVPLAIGARFSELEGCPIKLEGLATGKVACDENKKVLRVDVNTTFTLAHVPTEGTAVALEFATEESTPTAPATTSRTEQVPVPGPVPGPVVPGPVVPGPVVPPVGQTGPIIGKGGQIGKGGIVPPVVPPIGKGGQTGKGGTVPPVAPPVVKGGQGPTIPPVVKGGPVVPPVVLPGQTGPGKGGQIPPVVKGGPVVPPVKGGPLEHGQTVPANRVNACVSFAPCGFSTNASLSCGR